MSSHDAIIHLSLHIGHAKSTCASGAAKAINGALNVVPLQNRVSPDTEDVFDDSFWGGLDVVVNALDNVNARLYVDSRCVYFGVGGSFRTCTRQTLDLPSHSSRMYEGWH
jgi:molybdopterin/thiamine biosynthesis adenylyltransferase